jgi:hypothetical protein
MQIAVDEDVQAVIEFMQSRIQASKLVSVADSVPQMARLLWGQTPQEPCVPAYLMMPKPGCDPSQSAATE